MSLVESLRRLRWSLLAYAVGLVVIAATMVVGRLGWVNAGAVRQVGWEAVAAVLVGLVAVGLQKAAGFPDLLEPGLKARDRVLRPAVIGVAFGVADVVVFELITRTAPHAELPLYLQPFPYSLLLFTSGAWYVETLYRLLPLTFLMALARRFLPRRAWSPTFFVAAVVTSLVEPLNQLVDAPAWVMIYAFATGLAMNFTQSLLFRRSGWFASLSVRLGHYLVWHILLGVYVEFMVLA